MQIENKSEFGIYEIVNRLSPYIRRAWDHTMPLNWYLPKRIILDYELLYIMEGEAVVTINKKIYRASPGDLFLIRPMVLHSIQSVGKVPLRQPHVHFDFFYQEDSTEVYIPVWPMIDPGEDLHLVRKDIVGNLNIPDKIVLPGTFKFERLLFSLIDEYESGSIYSLVRQKAYMLELLAYIMEECNLYETDGQDLPKDVISAMGEAKTYIQNNVNRKLHVEELAKRIGFSRNYLCKMFQKCYGLTPMQFHMSLRMDRARYLLSVKGCSVTETAYELGFDSIHDFSRVFKRENGIAPLYFKQIISEEV